MASITYSASSPPRLIDTPPETVQGTPGMYPLTREDALQKARCFFGKASQKAPRIDSYYSYVRLEKDPAYTDAAAWPGYAEEFWDHDDVASPIFRMFQPPLSPELERWLLEYAHIQWPKRDLFDLMAATADRSLHPLHIAAALGLSKLCRSLLQDGADVNQLSNVGTPLYCALVGPHVLLRDADVSPDFFELALADCLSIAQEDTLNVLLDAGATGLNMSRPRFDTTLSVQCLAFLICLRLRSAALFKRLYPPPTDRFGFEVDYRFRSLLFKDDIRDISWAAESPGASAFFASAYSIIFDGLLTDFDESYTADLLTNLWVKMELMALDSPQDEIQPLPGLDDGRFVQMTRLAVRLTHEATVCRLSRDPRFDASILLNSPDLPTANSDEAGSTILHSAVCDDHLGIVAVLVQSGADIHARDDKGRTPLLLAESPGVLEALINHGADTADTDNEGRNIWHFVAANNDCELLHWLIAHDPQMDRNLQARMMGGRTPAAEAIVYPMSQLRACLRHDKPSGSWWLRGAMILLPYCRAGKEFLHSDDPTLTRAAVEWGSERLIKEMRKCGYSFGDVDARGNNAMHHLNFSATPELVRLLRQDCATLPMLNADGLSPADTIFLNSFLQGLPGQHQPHTPVQSVTAHPAFSGTLNREVFRSLITMTVESAETEDGRLQGLARCWERFVQHVLVEWASVMNPDDMTTVSPHHESIFEALDGLINLRTLDAYEQLRGGRPAAMLAGPLLFTKEMTPTRKWWHMVVFHTMSLAALRFTSFLGKTPITWSDEDLVEVDRILRWIIDNAGHSYSEAWVRELISRFFPIPGRLGSVPTLMYVCRSRCWLPVFEEFAKHALRLDEGWDMEEARRALMDNGLDDWRERAALLELVLRGGSPGDDIDD